MKPSCIRSSGLGALIAGLTTRGYASPPEAEKKAAGEAIAKARKFGAEKYAANPFAAAVEELQAAEALMVAKKYAAAQRTYLSAKKAGLKAAKTVDAVKTAMTPEVEQQLAEVVKQWEHMEGEIKAEKTLTGVQKRDWEVDTKRITATLLEARASLDDDPARTRERLAVVTALLEAWR
jgi:hypothetical protein